MTTLTRQHYKRLRFYWQGLANGGAGMTDGIDLDLAALGLVERFERFGYGVRFRITKAGEQTCRREGARGRAASAASHSCWPLGAVASESRSRDVAEHRIAGRP